MPHRSATPPPSASEIPPMKTGPSPTPTRLAPNCTNATESPRTRLSELEIGRAHVRTPVTNAHPVCRLLPATKKRRSADQASVRKSAHSHLLLPPLIHTPLATLHP